MPARTPYLPVVPRLLESREMHTIPGWAHPELRYWQETFLKIRDCTLGEQEIKAKGEFYLSRLSDMEDDEYEAYKDRAVFYNMTARTIDSLTGTVFQRPPKVKGIPARLQKAFDESVTYNGVSFTTFLNEQVEALVGPGRFGILTDMGPNGGVPFLRGYEAENILDWQVDKIDGRVVPVQIVLREFDQLISRTIGEARPWTITYRVLSLEYTPGSAEKPVYRQYVYVCPNGTYDLEGVEPQAITPTRRGVPLDHIPFEFVGSRNNAPSIDRPPAAPVVALNLAHYRAYAQLEQGRFYCAFPVYFVQTQANNASAEYTLGPSRVWEVGPNEKPGILEFHGTGLQSLENSCSQKEAQIEAIGGRMMGGGGGTQSEGSQTDAQFKTQETNERALLLRIVQNASDASAKALNTWAWWQDEDESKIEVELSTAFLFENLGARELRAAHELYSGGVIPITALHAYLEKAEVIPDWMDVDTLKSLLKRVEEFPNQPDVWAMQMGYSNAANRQQVLLQRRDLRNQETLTTIEQQRATTDHKDVTGTLDIKQQEVEVAAAAQKAKAKTDMVAAKNPAQGNIPGQVSAARQTSAGAGGAPGRSAPK